MTTNLSRYIPLADAVTALLHPYAEVVIHNLESDVIFYISNSFSGRELGDPSNLATEEPSDFTLDSNVVGPYEKTGSKGESIRSITAVLKDDSGKPFGILCINMNFSVIESALSVVQQFFNPENVEARPEILFKNEWRDMMIFEIRTYLKEHKQTLGHLNAKWRKAVLEHLDNKGLFYARKSVEQVASHLNMSRATVYNDLNKIRNGKKTE